MFLDIVILQTIARHFHRFVDDAVLDRCASECGCAPIGRMSLLDDDAMAAFAQESGILSARSVLDLGCGRGFLGRWLKCHGCNAAYTGVDRVAEALEAARKNVTSARVIQGDFQSIGWNERFDAVVAIELSVNGTLTDGLLDAAASALSPHGRFAATIVSLSGASEGTRDELRNRAEARFASVRIEDWSERARPFAERTYRWWLSNDVWHPVIREKAHLEARTALDAIQHGTFDYRVLFSRVECK